jgi:hypothetical protein
MYKNKTPYKSRLVMFSHQPGSETVGTYHPKEVKTTKQSELQSHREDQRFKKLGYTRIFMLGQDKWYKDPTRT